MKMKPILAAVASLVALSVHAQATCDSSDLFVSQGPNLSNPTRLYTIDTAVNPPVFVARGPNSGITYNALGYNPIDNTLYAMRTSTTGTRQLYTINQANGAEALVGAIAGLPVDRYNAGTFNEAGDYFIKATGNNKTIYRIDVTGRTFTTVTLSKNITVSDLAFVGADLYTVGDNAQLYRIDISGATGTVVDIGTPRTPARVLGAQFGGTNGLFGAANSDGAGLSSFFRIDTATGAWTRISSVPQSGVNDGANCPGARVEFPADLAITKTDGSGTYTPGYPVTYAITVENKGPHDALGAQVSDVLPAGITAASWTCVATGGGACTASGTGAIDDEVDLPVNAELIYTLTMDVPGTFTGDLVNTATVATPDGVTDPDPDNNTSTDTNTETTVPPVYADLGITKTDGNSTYVPGAAVVYTIVATNHGPSSVAGATVSDPLPAGITTASWTCAAAGGGACTASGSGAIHDSAVDLPVGASVEYTLTLAVPDTFSGDLVNTATVALPAGITDPNPGNNSATDRNVPNEADLGITKTDGNSTYVPGAEVVYTIVATNHGPSSVAGATVSDPLPAGITDASWTCAAAGGGACTASGSGAIHDSAVDLPVGVSVEYTLTLTVPDTFSGDLVNTATVALPAGITDPNPGNDSATDRNTRAVVGEPTPVPVNSGWMLAMLAGLLGWQVARRKSYHRGR